MKTIENRCGSIKIQISTPYTSFCSLGNAPFDGHFLITYIPNARLLEFVSYEEWLVDKANKPTTIEELTQSVFAALNDTLSPLYLEVECSAFTDVHGRVTAIVSFPGG